MKFNSPLVRQHEEAGHFLESQGMQSFYREEGKGEPVICLHGVPSSSFLYRKLLSELANKGYRGVAIDFPGMGLSDRPDSFDYSWTGLGRWAIDVTKKLAGGKFHLVIHDIGGHIGSELMAVHPERVLSLTILNTPIARTASFKKPWSMRPFGWRGIGELYLKSIHPLTLLPLFYLQGIENRSAFGYAEAAAYVELLKGKDGGKAFLKIMRGFETTKQKEDLYIDAIKKLSVPKQIIWGENDPANPLHEYGLSLKSATGIERFIKLPAKHFLQEDQSPAIATNIADLNL